MAATEIVALDIDNFPIKEAIQFFKDIDPRSRKLRRLRKQKYENDASLQEIQSKGREVVQELIYDAYEPLKYKRTYALLHSILSDKDIEKDKETGSLALYSDPSIATAEQTDGLFSYAAFFELPVEYKTFIPPRGIASRPVNYRPFFETWEKLMYRINNKLAKSSIEESIQELMPPELQK